MKVKIHDKWTQAGRRTYPSTVQVIGVSIVKENKRTVWVKLSDGNIINRKRSQIVSM